MKALILQRSAYSFIETPIPYVLEQLTDQITSAVAVKPGDVSALLQEPSIILTENLIRRMGDVALYAGSLKNELEGENPWRAATISGSLLVGYFSAAKSLLDAVSISITFIFSLPLKPKEQDFSKEKFWKEIRIACPQVAVELQSMSGFINNVIKWRDAAVHRKTPMVLVHATEDQIGDRPPEDINNSEVSVLMCTRPDVEFSTLKSQKWISPMQIPVDWQPKFEELSKVIASVVARIL